VAGPARPPQSGHAAPPPDRREVGPPACPPGGHRRPPPSPPGAWTPRPGPEVWALIRAKAAGEARRHHPSVVTTGGSTRAPVHPRAHERPLFTAVLRSWVAGGSPYASRPGPRSSPPRARRWTCRGRRAVASLARGSLWSVPRRVPRRVAPPLRRGRRRAGSRAHRRPPSHSAAARWARQKPAGEAGSPREAAGAAGHRAPNPAASQRLRRRPWPGRRRRRAREEEGGYGGARRGPGGPNRGEATRRPWRLLHHPAPRTPHPGSPRPQKPPRLPAGGRCAV